MPQKVSTDLLKSVPFTLCFPHGVTPFSPSLWRKWKRKIAHCVTDMTSHYATWPVSSTLPSSLSLISILPCSVLILTILFPHCGCLLLFVLLQGAVMSVHSRTQRFEVLPNGTLIIQNVQPQDRGTYICSAQSFLGRDR